MYRSELFSRVSEANTRLRQGPSDHVAVNGRSGEYDEVDVEELRRKSERKLQGRFKSIYAKYDRDFGDSTDEIDLLTGEVVVNNGHLRHMRHERDVGRKPRLHSVTESRDRIVKLGTGDDNYRSSPAHRRMARATFDLGRRESSVDRSSTSPGDLAAEVVQNAVRKRTNFDPTDPDFISAFNRNLLHEVSRIMMQFQTPPSPPRQFTVARCRPEDVQPTPRKGTDQFDSSPDSTPEFEPSQRRDPKKLQNKSFRPQPSLWAYENDEEGEVEDDDDQNTRFHTSSSRIAKWKSLTNTKWSDEEVRSLIYLRYEKKLSAKEINKRFADRFANRSLWAFKSRIRILNARFPELKSRYARRRSLDTSNTPHDDIDSTPLLHQSIDTSRGPSPVLDQPYAPFEDPNLQEAPAPFPADSKESESQLQVQSVKREQGLTLDGEPRIRNVEACITCRAKKRKCDGAGPTQICSYCMKNGIECRWSSNTPCDNGTMVIRDSVEPSDSSDLDERETSRCSAVPAVKSRELVRYTAEEDRLIIHLREEKGLQWQEIGPYLPERTYQALTTRYNDSLKANAPHPVYRSRSPELVGVECPTVKASSGMGKHGSHLHSHDSPSSPLGENSDIPGGSFEDGDSTNIVPQKGQTLSKKRKKTSTEEAEDILRTFQTRKRSVIENEVYGNQMARSSYRHPEFALSDSETGHGQLGTSASPSEITQISDMSSEARGMTLPVAIIDEAGENKSTPHETWSEESECGSESPTTGSRGVPERRILGATESSIRAIEMPKSELIPTRRVRQSGRQSCGPPEKQIPFRASRANSDPTTTVAKGPKCQATSHANDHLAANDSCKKSTSVYIIKDTTPKMHNGGPVREHSLNTKPITTDSRTSTTQLSRPATPNPASHLALDEIGVFDQTTDQRASQNLANDDDLGSEDELGF